MDGMMTGASGSLDSDTLLRSIAGPDDLKRLSDVEVHELCRQIRRTLLRYGHLHGGHIGSNLGMVEATVALHRVFDSPRDRIVFDVSHQSYVHKMLTGRAAAYLDADRFGEVTGFTNPGESEHDQFVLGHTGTSISLACGLAKTRDMEGEASGIGNVVAIIGDGSLSSGVAFEGLNNAAEQGGNLIVIVNDNEMSIAGDFGGMYGPLTRLRASGGTAQPNLFEAFGFEYRYVGRGNDVDALTAAFREVKDIDHPVVVHIHTLKGAGYPDCGCGCGRDAGLSVPSERSDDASQEGCGMHGANREGRGMPGANQEARGIHGANREPRGIHGAIERDDSSCRNAAPEFSASDAGVRPACNVSHTEPWHSDHCNLSDHDPHEGQCEASHWQNPDAALGRPDDPRKHYGKLAMAALEPRFANEPGLVVISPATPGSNGITHEFRERAGAHYVDTGITESHAVAFAAGIARAGGTPVVATTASFFQRAYDQFFQEMSLNRSRVTVLDFLGGLSGSDNTHSGAYDVMMFANIPGVTMLAPTSQADFLADLAWATMPDGHDDGARKPDDRPRLSATEGRDIADAKDGIGGGAFAYDHAGERKRSEQARSCEGASAGSGGPVAPPDGPVVIRVPGEPILAAERDASLLPLTGDRPAPQVVLGDTATPDDVNCDSSRQLHPLHPSGNHSEALSIGQMSDPLAWRVTHAGSRVAIIGLGNTYPLAERTAAALMHDRSVAVGGRRTDAGEDTASVHGPSGTSLNVTVIDPRQCSSLDVAALESLREDHELVVTLEDGQLEGGWGEKVTAYYANHRIDGARTPRVLNFGADKEFTDRVSLADLNERYGLTVTHLAKVIRAALV